MEVEKVCQEIIRIDSTLLELLDRRKKLSDIAKVDTGMVVKEDERGYTICIDGKSKVTDREISVPPSDLTIDGKLGIIGFGRMGELLAQGFSKRMDIGVYDKGAVQTKRYEVYTSLKGLYSDCDHIMIATSMDAVSDILHEIAQISTEGDNKVIFDISTFKEGVIDNYDKFPDSVKVVSTHPLFGPGISTFIGKRMVVIPLEGREDDADVLFPLFKSLGFELHTIDMKTHDDMMKKVIGTPYFLAIAFLNMISKTEGIEEYGGNSFEYLKVFSKSVLHDKPEFIEEIIKGSRDTIHEFLKDSEPSELKVERLAELYSEDIDGCYRLFNRLIEFQ